MKKIKEKYKEMNVTKDLKSTLETFSTKKWRKQMKIVGVVDLKEYECYSATHVPVFTHLLREK